MRSPARNLSWPVPDTASTERLSVSVLYAIILKSELFPHAFSPAVVVMCARSSHLAFNSA